MRNITSSWTSHLVLDFDGTLFSREPTAFVMDRRSQELSRLHDEGMSLCIASGRGTAVRRYAQFLAKSAGVSSHVIRWNGLEGMSVPSSDVLFKLTAFEREELSIISETLRTLRLSPQTLKAEIVRVKTRSPKSVPSMIRLLRKLLTEAIPGIVCTSNQKVVDISPPGCDKFLAVQRLFPGVEADSFLAVGDSCTRFGNDYELLRHLPSYCVGSHYRSRTCVGRPVVNDEGSRIVGPPATFRILKSLSGPGRTRAGTREGP